VNTRKVIFLLLIGFIIHSCHSATERLEEYEVHGIDVSHYQKRIDWKKVEQEDFHFAFVKATEGGDYVDSLFQHNWNELEESSIRRGAYHFFRPDVSGAVQAINFLTQVDLKDGDLPPVLDVEVSGGRDEAHIVKMVNEWLEIVEMRLGVKPIIYSNQKYYLKYLTSFGSDYVTWIARYNNVGPEIGYDRQWDFWQYGDRGRVDGIKGDVDLNVFQGSLETLDKLCIKERPIFTESLVSN